MTRGDENSVAQANPPAAELRPPPRDYDSLLSESSFTEDAASSTRHPNRIRVGSLIAQRYEVLGVLGEGGMGIVYRCRDRHAGEQVAVKRVILPEGRLADDYVSWFYKEARALASLSHKNIVGARDFGVLPDRSPYLAMQLVGGLSLHDYSNARLSFPIIWSIVDQVLGALAHAHSRRVIHGDLKPSNVIVEEGGGGAPDVHILDFGLAWLKEDPHDERLDGEKAMEFQPHAGAGTPGYMAPEQIMHEMHHVCGATDMYSLACILYKLLSGRAPFTGDPKELLKLHAYEPPPALKPAVAVPEGVIEFVQRCLRKRPWERFEFAAEARRAWEVFKPEGEIDPRLWRFPRIAGAVAPPSLSPADATTPRLSGSIPAPPLDRNRGLLGIRPSPLVGRGELRQRLQAICAEVTRGAGAPHRLAILVGPAGIGKSRLAEWLAETVHEEGRMVPLVARYRRVRGSTDGMLGAVTQYFNFERADRNTIERSLLARWGVRSDDQKMRTWVAGAAEYFRPSAPGGEALGPSGVRFTLDTLEVRRQVVRFTLRRIAATRPLLFVLDDLHNAAQTTIDGLLKIHETERDQRIFMVATVRAEDVQLGTATAERLRRLREKMDGEVIEVNPMDKDETAELLRASLPLDDEAVVEAVRRSRGFPLFALQQLHAWALAGDLAYESGHFRVPASVLAVRPQTTADLWESRVASLPEEFATAAYAASTLGLDIRRNVLKALLEQLGQKGSEAIVSLQNAEIILPRGPGRYNWPHALLQEHLFRRLSERPDSRQLFRAAAEALLAHPLAGTRRIVRQRVVNLLYAREPEQAAQTFFKFLEQSWNGARQPLATLADLDLFRGQLTGATQAVAQRWRAEALRHVGQTEEATHHAEQAERVLSSTELRDELAHCQRLLGQLRSEQGDSDAGLQLAHRALTAFKRSGNTLGMAQCDQVIGEIELQLGRYATAREFGRSAEAHFRSLDLALGRGQCLLLIAAVDHSEGATDRARRLTLEARQEFERAGYQLGQAETSASLAHLEHRLSNFFNAEQGAHSALAAFEALKTLPGQASCERLLAMVALDTDNLDAGELHADRAERLYAQIRDPLGVVEARLLRAQLALARRDLPNARRVLMQAREISVKEPEPRQHYLLTRAWFQFESGDTVSAEEALNAAPTVFAHPWHVGDHTPHLLARLARLAWPRPETLDQVEEWRGVIHDHARRDQT
ncbi:MAG TPA: protein kinase [Polyangiaceae bacterium]|nr:protein kinase [Polyangiaceae bacterium]